MAGFLLKHIDPYLLAAEFQPLCILQSVREEQLKKALVFDQDDEPLDEAQVPRTIDMPGSLDPAV